MTDLIHIYAFGSICRGEIDSGSDIDLLAIVSGGTKNELSRSMFSIYSHSKVRKIWQEGNPFAWHLHTEAKLIHSNDGSDFFGTLGPPATYVKAREDCDRFFKIFRQASMSVIRDQDSAIFDLSAAFLGIRNFATCYLLGKGNPDFSRRVALNLMDDLSHRDLLAYEILERARLLCTRGHGEALTGDEIGEATASLPMFERRILKLTEDRGDDW